MRREHDSAIERVLPRNVEHDQVVVRLPGVVGHQEAIAIVLKNIVGHGGMTDAHEMESSTTIKAFVGLETRQARTRRSSRVECLVIVHHVVVPDRYGGRIGYKQSLEVGVLECEPRYDDVFQARVVEAINIDAVGEARRVDDSFVRPRAYQ